MSWWQQLNFERSTFRSIFNIRTNPENTSYDSFDNDELRVIIDTAKCHCAIVVVVYILMEMYVWFVKFNGPAIKHPVFFCIRWQNFIEFAFTTSILCRILNESAHLRCERNLNSVVCHRNYSCLLTTDFFFCVIWFDSRFAPNIDVNHCLIEIQYLQIIYRLKRFIKTSSGHRHSATAIAFDSVCTCVCVCLWFARAFDYYQKSTSSTIHLTNRCLYNEQTFKTHNSCKLINCLIWFLAHRTETIQLIS